MAPLQNRPPPDQRYSYAPQQLKQWDRSAQSVVFFVAMPTPLVLPHGTIMPIPVPRQIRWEERQRGTPRETAPAFGSMRVWQLPQTVTSENVHLAAALGALRQMVLDDPQMVAEVRKAEATLAEQSFSTTTTVIEVVMPLVDAWNVDPETTLQRTFELCLEHLNLVLRAYAITTGDIRVGSATRHSLTTLVPFVLQNSSAKTWGDVQFLVLNPTVPSIPLPVQVPADFMPRMWSFLNRLYRDDPLSWFLDWELVARKARLADGNYALCVIAAHTATEVLFDSLLLLMAWEEGMSGKTAMEWFVDGGLAKRLRTHFGVRLGGNWDPLAKKGVISQWHEHVALVRNRVVHARYQPTDQQARKALEVVQSLHEHLERLVASKRTKYPRTALMFVGKEGLDLLGLYSGKIKRYLEQEGGTGLEWLDQYRAWTQS